MRIDIPCVSAPVEESAAQSFDGVENRIGLRFG
jgi:hypothetical protein